MDKTPRYDKWHELIDEVNRAYESGDDERIEMAERELFNFGAYVDSDGVWINPYDPSW